MRQNHYEGLNKVGRRIVQRCFKTELPEPNSDMPFEIKHPFAGLALVKGAKVEVYARIDGAFMDTEAGEYFCDLHRYTLPSGVRVEEYLQCEPWAGGPHWFLALRRVKSRKHLKTTIWSEKVTQIRAEHNIDSQA